MRLWIVLGLALVLGTPALLAQTDQQQVDQIFAAYDKPNSPGCALGVIQNGAFVYRKGYGAGSLELGVPLSTQSVFYMASASKQFTAASVVLAAEQGFLSLDDDIHKYIPELHDYGKPITLREMLHHTSGFRDYFGLFTLSGENPVDIHTSDEVLRLIARQKALNYSPGAEFLYSNTNYLLLAEVVKRATKKPLSEFAAENIFQPLGMTHTRFDDDRAAVVPGRVPAYDSGKNGSFLLDWSTNFDLVGDGGLLSTVDDLLLWDHNFYENRLGKGSLLKELQTVGALNSGKKTNYALGLQMGDYRGLPIVEHGGALFGYRTEILRFPNQRFSVVCLCNLASANTSDLSRKVADFYLKKDLKSEAAPKPQKEARVDSDPAPFVGKYLMPSNRSSVSFSVSGGNLIMGSQNMQGIGSNRFSGPDGMIVTFANSHRVMSVAVEIGGNVVFVGSRIEDLRLDALALSAYAGDYASAELGVTYRLSVENGYLMLRINWNSPLKLTATVRDEFQSDLGILTFQRDANGHLSGLSVSDGRIRNLVFTRIQ